MTLDGEVFNLLQFHFHTLSEHTVADERFMMEFNAVSVLQSDRYVDRAARACRTLRGTV